MSDLSEYLKRARFDIGNSWRPQDETDGSTEAVLNEHAPTMLRMLEATEPDTISEADIAELIQWFEPQGEDVHCWFDQCDTPATWRWVFCCGHAYLLCEEHHTKMLEVMELQANGVMKITCTICRAHIPTATHHKI